MSHFNKDLFLLLKRMHHIQQQITSDVRAFSLSLLRLIKEYKHESLLLEKYKNLVNMYKCLWETCG